MNCRSSSYLGAFGKSGQSLPYMTGFCEADFPLCFSRSHSFYRSPGPVGRPTRIPHASLKGNRFRAHPFPYTVSSGQIHAHPSVKIFWKPTSLSRGVGKKRQPKNDTPLPRAIIDAQPWSFLDAAHIDFSKL